MTPDQVSTLKRINQALNRLQARIHQQAIAHGQAMLANGLDIAADITCCMALPANAGTNGMGEQLLASRTWHRPELPDLVDFQIHEPHSPIGPQGWLFHDLTEHSYGPENPAVPHCQLLWLSAVHVELKFIQTLQLDLKKDFE